MTYFKDLTRYEYSRYGYECTGELWNVGWLDRTAPYPKGDVAPDLTEKLLARCKWPVNQFFGWHDCHFCGECPVRIADPDREFCLGDGEIHVARKDGKGIYFAPNLIYHYVVAHQYLPTGEFLDELRDITLAHPSVAIAIPWIEDFQHGLLPVGSLSNLLGWFSHRNKPPLPLAVRSAVLEAANELEIVDKTAGRDARQRAESIVGRLNSVLTNG
jgi:hypothetical protein